MFFTAVSEDFVQFVWQYTLYDSQSLFTTCGQRIQVLFAGEQNHIGGPDFFKAKIQIDDTLWIGNVEIHVTNKEWYQHKHHLDEAYNNVILHVVFEEKAEPVLLANQRKVPSLVIGSKIHRSTLNSYWDLQRKGDRFIPCEGLIAPQEAFLFHHLYTGLALERLERKVNEIERDMEWTQGDLDSSFLILLMRHFGSPVNKQPFEQLARSLNYSHLIKQSSSIVQLESYIFGMANLLHDQDVYARRLGDEFAYTRKLYKLEVGVNTSAWKFSGNRPPNFPTIRLAQLAALLYSNVRPLANMLNAPSLSELRNIFCAETSAYWKAHYAFGKEWERSGTKLSPAFIDKLLINVIVPYVFFYGRHTGKDELKSRALNYLEEIKAEENVIIERFRKHEFHAQSALDSQALLQLYTRYCKVKRCLSCKWGYQLLKRK